MIVTKEAVKFRCKGEMGSGCIILKNNSTGEDENVCTLTNLL